MKKDDFLIFFAAMIIWVPVAVGMSNDVTIDAILFALFLSFLFVLLGRCISELVRRKRLGIDLTAKLENNPEKVKSDMMFIMQHNYHGGIKGSFKVFDTYFRNYPEWELSKWIVFRSWYKHQIDFMMERPEIYTLRDVVTKEQYRKENDPMYDFDAPDWSTYKETFDDNYNADDDYEDDNDDAGLSLCQENPLKDSMSTGFGIGIGLGLGGVSIGGGS